MKITSSIALVAALGMAGCVTTAPSIVSASEAGITIRVKANNVPAAEAEAKAYCEGKGRTAVLDRVTPDGNEATVSFYCR
jgi:Pyruvate/2-oxoacid:ferredoxin oxidoreductase gamma subunit